MASISLKEILLQLHFWVKTMTIQRANSEFTPQSGNGLLLHLGFRLARRKVATKITTKHHLRSENLHSSHFKFRFPAFLHGRRPSRTSSQFEFVDIDLFMFMLDISFCNIDIGSLMWIGHTFSTWTPCFETTSKKNPSGTCVPVPERVSFSSA